MLARQGFERQTKDRTRVEAGWLSLILSTQYSEPVTVAQLLGEPEPDAGEVTAKKLTAAEKRLAKLQAGKG